MLTEAYIEALLVDEELADLVGEALDSGEIDSQRAHTAWLLIATSVEKRPCCKDQFQETHRRPSGPDREP